VAGFDLTFSAPKSVSVVFALGDRNARGAVRDAHDGAAREAIAYLEVSAAAVRRGHGGARVEPASGLIGAAFWHRTSRVGDPQLHTHVLVANLGRGPDGR
jgi:conjugative relaxase-like TrwC/TraI family protein